MNPILIVTYSPNNTYNVLVNGQTEKTGSLLEDFDPPFNPPKEIDDPEDSKPEDWVDEEKIPDPDAKKVCTCISILVRCETDFSSVA